MNTISLQCWRPNDELAAAMNAPLPPDPHNYICGDQRLLWGNLAANTDTIIVMALRGLPSKMIAASLGISREAVDQRLRPLGMKNAPGVLGRPKRSQPVAIQSIRHAAAPAHC